MTTLLVSEIFPPKVGGSGRWLSELYRRLPQGRYRVAAGIESTDELRHGTLPIDAVPLSFATRFVRPSSWPQYKRAYGRLEELVRLHQVKQIHCARTVPEGLLGAALSLRFNIPFACYAHGEEVNLSNPEQAPGRLRRRVYGSRELAMMVGLVLSRAGFVIANSRNTRSILTQRWQLPARKIEQLYPGVDLTRFTPACHDPEHRRRLGWNGRNVLLTVGRLQKRKGHDSLLEAVAELRQTWPDVLLAIVGSGEEEETLRRLSTRLELKDHVQFIGEIDDQALVSSYQQCDVFVLANRDIDGDIEGFGMVLLEAQACARPVIAGSSGGTAEALLAGETGFIVDCSQPTELVRVLDRLLTSPELARRLGERGHQWVTSNFGWDSLSRQAEQIFERRADS